jgi:hypothetical protein
MNKPRLVTILTPWERKHPQVFAGMRIGGGIALLIIAAILLSYDVWWGVLLVPVAAVCFYAAYLNPGAIRAAKKRDAAK